MNDPCRTLRAGAAAGDGTPLELVACGHDARQQWGYGEPAPPPLPSQP